MSAMYEEGVFRADVNEVQVDTAAVKHYLRTNSEFCIQFFLGEELTFPVPTLHIETLDLLKSSTALRIVLAIPRGHAKTTLSKIAVVWFFLFTEYAFIVYVSNTSPIAKNAVSDIMDYMRCDNFRAVFGDIQILKADAGLGLYRFVIPGISKTCTIRAIGAGQQMRGINIGNLRPQMAVVDDLEDYDNTSSLVQINSLSQWVFGTFIKALDNRRPKIIWLGNMLSNDSILKKNCESERWFSRVYGAILSDGTPLWPDMWSIEALIEDYKEYQLDGRGHIWMAEMMNNPTPSGSGLIKINEIKYIPKPDPELLQYPFITIDPAISQKTWADKSGIVVHGYVPEQRCWTAVEYVEERLNPLQLFNVTFILMQRYGVKTIGIEAAGYQASLQFFFPYLLQERGVRNVEIIGLPSRNTKNERLAGWCGMLRSGDYKLPVGDVLLTNQLMGYDPINKKNRDDLIDAAANGPVMINEHMHQLSRDPDRHLVPFTPQSEAEMCEI